MFFLKLSNTNVLFNKKILIWRTYTINKNLLIIKQVQIIDKKNFVITALNANSEMFVIYIVIQEQKKMLVYFKKQAQIKTSSRA